MSERSSRVGSFQVDVEQENLQFELNQRLQGVDAGLYGQNDNQEHPLVFICYPPRSGSTLLTQYLCLSGRFNYISNFMAKFWEAPVFGYRLESTLGLRNQHRIEKHNFKSSYGTSQDHFLPHEFGFFWNKFLTNSTHHIDLDKFSEERLTLLRKTILTLLNQGGMPMFIKNGIIGMNTHVLREIFPKSHFIVVKRDIDEVVRSIYRGRVQIYADRNKWWSLKPKDYLEIEQRFPEQPFHQIILQVKSIYKTIYSGLEGYSNFYELEYGDFCLDPKKKTLDILDFIGVNQDGGESFDNLPVQFQRSKRLLKADEELELQKALTELC